MPLLRPLGNQHDTSPDACCKPGWSKRGPGTSPLLQPPWLTGRHWGRLRQVELSRKQLMQKRPRCFSDLVSRLPYVCTLNPRSIGPFLPGIRTETKDTTPGMQLPAWQQLQTAHHHAAEDTTFCPQQQAAPVPRWAT